MGGGWRPPGSTAWSGSGACREGPGVPVGAPASRACHSLLSRSPRISTAARLSSGSLLFPHFGDSAEEQQTNHASLLPIGGTLDPSFATSWRSMSGVEPRVGVIRRIEQVWHSGWCVQPHVREAERWKPGKPKTLAAGLYEDEKAIAQDAVRALLSEEPHQRLELTIHRYRAEEISLAKAVALAGVSWERMREILLGRGVVLRLN